MFRAEGAPKAEQPRGKTDGTITTIRFREEGDKDKEELPGEGKDTLPGVEEEDEFSAACAGKATDVEGGEGVYTCGLTRVEGACDAEELGVGDRVKRSGCERAGGRGEPQQDRSGGRAKLSPRWLVWNRAW